MSGKKTGGGGGTWIVYDSPKPPAVPESEHYGDVGEATNDQSERCRWWVRQINRGWRPNRHILNCCWDCNSEWLGVRGWEYMDVIAPLLWPPKPPPAPVYGPPTFAEFFAAGIKADLQQALNDELNRMIFGDNGAGTNLKGIVND